MLVGFGGRFVALQVDRSDRSLEQACEPVLYWGRDFLRNWHLVSVLGEAFWGIPNVA